MIDTEKPFNIANITIYPKTDEMCCDGVTIEIKSMAMKMICYFASHHEDVVTRQSLRENIWANSNASDHTINNHMYTLRQLFAKFDSDNKYFHTVTGSEGGYRLLAEVTQAEPNTGNTQELHPQNVTDEAQVAATLSGKQTVKVDKPTSKYKQLPFLSVCMVTLFIGLLFLPVKPKEDMMTTLTSMTGREQNPTVSQDGTILLFANRRHRESTWELYASRLSSDSMPIETKKVFESTSRNENYVSISPNKKQIAFIRFPKEERGIYLADFNENTLSASNARLIIPLKTMNLSPVISWLDDTTFFYNATQAISAPRKIYKYDVTSGQSEPISAPPLNTYGDFAAIVSPSKKWLAVMRSDESYGYQLFLYDLHKKILIETDVKNSKERLNVSFSDNSEFIFFIDQAGGLSQYNIENKQVSQVSSLDNIGYWPLKIPGKNQFVVQQDWGLSSLTNRIMRINNPVMGGDGQSEVIVDNNLSIRSITRLGNKGIIFASITANQDIELWKYQQEQSTKLNKFNGLAHQHTYLSLDWMNNSDTALLSINDTCYLIDVNTGKDTPLCPANEALYAGRFSKDGQSIYLVGKSKKTHSAVKMGASGYPLTPLRNINGVNSIHEGEQGEFYYSKEPSFDIYHYNAKTGTSKKIIDRTFVIERFSNNDFVVSKSGIYFMDRKEIKENAIYFYDFTTQMIRFVAPSKDNYPHVVVSEDEQYLYLIESYDNNSQLSLIELNN